MGRVSIQDILWLLVDLCLTAIRPPLDRYWSKLNGDDEITWGPDPLLTPLGLAQAVDAQEVWRREAAHGVPVPERHFLSPLKRALDTWKATFLVEEESNTHKGLILEVHFLCAFIVPMSGPI